MYKQYLSGDLHTKIISLRIFACVCVFDYLLRKNYRGAHVVSGIIDLLLQLTVIST